MFSQFGAETPVHLTHMQKIHELVDMLVHVFQAAAQVTGTVQQFEQDKRPCADFFQKPENHYNFRTDNGQNFID